jgi:hypothetical protein
MSVKPYPEYKNEKSLWGNEAIEDVDRSRAPKQGVKVAGTAGSVGSVTAQSLTGYNGIALATGAAAASATGIGLVVGGGLLTVGSCVFAARSAYKSYRHRNVLQEIFRRGAELPCQKIPSYGNAVPGLHKLLPRNAVQHDAVLNGVLPYLISQKDAKFKRKAFSAVPGAALLETMRAVGKKAYKQLAGTLGVDRKHAARWLAIHLITHDCALTQAIVAELYSFEEMLLLKTYDSDKVVPYLEDKMKSA